MANLNLSQFGEKLFVADADHTFIWDTAASISKRVSRNSWLNSGTLTSDAPVTISQTWNNAAVVFTGLKVNAAGTSDANSASGSLLADFQLNGVSKALVAKSGVLVANTFALGGDYPVGITRIGDGGLRFIRSNVAGAGFSGIAPILDVAYDGIDFFLNLVNVAATLRFGSDTRLQRDGAANTLALRNGANTQTFNVYGSYGSISDYKRLSISCDQTTGNATITNQAAGYTAGTVSINGVPVGLGLLNVSTSVAIGTGALAANTSALGANTAVGYGSLLAATNNFQSTSIGYRALAGLNAFSNANVALGYEAGSLITSGTNFQCSTSVFIGANTKALGNNQNNQIVIGASAIGIGQNSVVLGNDSIEKTALKGNVGIGTTSPTSKLHVAGSSSPSITVDNTLATGASQLLFKNTVVTGDTDGIFLNGSTQTGFGGAGSLNIKATTGPLAFHTASVTNALSIAQNGVATFAISIAVNSAVRTSFINNIGDSLSMFNFVNDSTGTSTYAVGGSAPLMRFGGTTTSFPAIKRSATTLQIRLANDSDFAPIQGKLTTETAFTATTVVPTGFITLYDSTGTAYKVPCVQA